MQNNFLEELVAEWLEYNGYFVKRNERVGPLPTGGYKGELDVVAFKPKIKHLIHVEATTDTDSWENRESRFRDKFALGDEYIKDLFEGLTIPDEIEKKVLFAYVSNTNHETVGGGKVVPAKDYLLEILREFKKQAFLWRTVPGSLWRTVPEKYPILRVLQMVAYDWGDFDEELNK